MANLAQVTESALQLSIDERAALANQLLASLDDIGGDEAEALWGRESARRLGAFHSGNATVSSSEEVARKAAALFR